MSLSAALRAGSARTHATDLKSTTTPGGGSAATNGVPSASDAGTKLHFFPLPAPPRWRKIEVTGAALPPCASATLTALNHGRTLLLYGGVRGQTPVAALHGSAALAKPPQPSNAGSSGAGVQTNGSAALSNSVGVGLAGSSALPLQACATLSSDMYLIDVPTGRCLGMGPRFGVESSHTARMGHAATPLDPHTLLVHGGWNNRRYVSSSLLVDLRHKQVFYEASSSSSADGDAGKFRAMPSPPRRDHALVSVGRRSLYMFGGWDGEQCLGDVWVCRLRGRPRTWTWSPFTVSPSSSSSSSSSSSPPGPSPRRGHTACVLGRKIWLFGGLSGFSSFNSEVHILDLSSGTWSSPPASVFGGRVPSARAWHTCCAVPGDSGYMLLWGGAGPDATFLNDLHLLDSRAMRWYALVQSSVQTEANLANKVAAATMSTGHRAPPPPPPPAVPVTDLPAPRAAHSACMVGSKLYIHGGLVPTQLPNPSGNGTSSVVLPSHDLYELDTFLPPDMLQQPQPQPPHGSKAAGGNDDDGNEGEYSSDEEDAYSGSDDDEEEQEGDEEGGVTEDGQEEDATAGGEHRGGERGARGSLHGARTHSRSTTQQGSSSNGGSASDTALSLQATEGWLAIASAPSKADVSSSSSSPVWSRRFVRLEHHSLLAYHPEPRTSGPLTLERDAVVKLWEDVHATLAGELRREEKAAAVAGTAQADLQFIATQNAASSLTAAAGGLASPSPSPSSSSSSASVSSAASLGFALKKDLTDYDRNVPLCEHCLAKFSSKSTKHRLFCAYCHGVFCDRCTQNLTALPSDFQRLVGGSVMRVRTCDACDHVLAARNRADIINSGGGSSGLRRVSKGGQQQKCLHAFSYTSRRTNQPIHLASESRATADEWVSVLKQICGGGSSGGSPHKSSVSAVYHEGSLMQEEGSSKVWKRCYCVLRGTSLTFFDLQLNKTFRLGVDTLVHSDGDVTQSSVASVRARGAAAAAAMQQVAAIAAAENATMRSNPLLALQQPLSHPAENSDPALWAVLYTFTVTNERSEGTSTAAASSKSAASASSGVGGNSNFIQFAAATSLERSHWMRQLAGDVSVLRERAGLVGASAADEQAGGAGSGAGGAALSVPPPAASKHPRVRSVSTPFVAGASESATTAQRQKEQSGAALALLSSLAARK